MKNGKTTDWYKAQLKKQAAAMRRARARADAAEASITKMRSIQDEYNWLLETVAIKHNEASLRALHKDYADAKARAKHDNTPENRRRVRIILEAIRLVRAV